MDFANRAGACHTDTTILKAVDGGCVISRRAARGTGYSFFVYHASATTGRACYFALVRRDLEFQRPIRPAGDFSRWHSYRGRGLRRQRHS